MRQSWTPFRIAAAVVAAACLAGWAVPAADDEEALRQQALALNRVTGKDPIQAKTKALAQDPAAAKKLLAVATRMAREKDQPFNFNAAIILARAAHELRDLDAGRTFYRLGAGLALKVQSEDKLVQTYGGLIDLLTEHKQFDESIKVSQEFLELPEGEPGDAGRGGPVRNLKSAVMRRLILNTARQGKTDEALKLIDKFLGKSADGWRGQAIKAEVLGEAGRFDEALASYDKIFALLKKDNRLDEEDKKLLAGDYAVQAAQLLVKMARKGKAAAALAAVEKLLKEQPDGWRLRLFAADVQTEAGRFEDAIASYRQMLNLLKKDDTLEPEERDSLVEEFSGLVTVALVKMMRQGKSAEALKLAEKLVREQPNNWRLRGLNAELVREAGRPAEALKAYQEVLQQVGQARGLSAEQKERIQKDLRYRLSNVYVDLGQIDKAAGELKALLDQEPDNPTYNNDLGYIWADHDQNLDEAERMIRKALDEDRRRRAKDGEGPHDNASYIDSLGWVLFKKKQYAEAKKYLLQAVGDKEEGQNIEIYDHLADAHMALGEKAEAVQVWQKALQLKISSRREEQRKAEVEKKLKAAQK